MNSVSSPSKPFRVIETGLRGGRANIAFDQALIDARSEGKIPNTIRFLRFRPSALIGIHQFLNHEIKLDYCKAHGIETVRRITGGGGLYFDEGQIGWELIFDRATLGVTDLAEVTRRICEAAALELQKSGVPARYRPRNDIEVDSRKISGAEVFRRQPRLLLSRHTADRFRSGEDAGFQQIFRPRSLPNAGSSQPRSVSPRCAKYWAMPCPISKPSTKVSSPALPRASASPAMGTNLRL